MDDAAYLDLVIEIIRRSDEQKGFQILPRPGVVERIDVSYAMNLVAMGGNLLRRTAHP